jgi:hypothetical protein
MSNVGNLKSELLERIVLAWKDLVDTFYHSQTNNKLTRRKLMSENSFLKQLEEEFSVKSSGSGPETYIAPYKNHNWTLRTMTFSDVEIATSLMYSEGVSLHFDLRYKVSFASVYIAAIDNKPIWEVFNIVEPGEVVSALAGHNPLDPPIDIKIKAAKALYRFLENSKKVGLIGHLHEAYMEHLDPEVAENELTELQQLSEQKKLNEKEKVRLDELKKKHSKEKLPKEDKKEDLVEETPVTGEADRPL